MKATDIKKITDIITEERAILIQLLSISEHQKAFIVKDDIVNLGNLLEREELLSSELGMLEEQRMLLTDALAEKLGWHDGPLTLKQIIELTEDNEAKGKLLALYAELTELLRKQKRYNRTNQELIKRKKNYINVMLGALLQNDPISNTYNCSGSVSNRYPSTGMFDQSV